MQECVYDSIYITITRSQPHAKPKADTFPLSPWGRGAGEVVNLQSSNRRPSKRSLPVLLKLHDRRVDGG